MSHLPFGLALPLSFHGISFMQSIGPAWSVHETAGMVKVIVRGNGNRNLCCATITRRTKEERRWQGRQSSPRSDQWKFRNASRPFRQLKMAHIGATIHALTTVACLRCGKSPTSLLHHAAAGEPREQMLLTALAWGRQYLPVALCGMHLKRPSTELSSSLARPREFPTPSHLHDRFDTLSQSISLSASYFHQSSPDPTPSSLASEFRIRSILSSRHQVISPRSVFGIQPHHGPVSILLSNKPPSTSLESQTQHGRH